jgi:glucose/arabinose dehydrogenase
MAKAAFSVLALFLSCGSHLFAYQPVLAFPNLSFHQPVWLTYPQDDSHRLFVVEQPGIVRVFPNRSDTTQSKVFLDISAKVRTEDPEEGLLCLAFHPRFRENHFLYVFYSLKDADPRRTVLSRFTASGDQADPKSEKVLFEVAKPFGNHNGSTILFGPDAHLYVSLGDGGSGGDPYGNAQNIKSFLGKVLRFDVDSDKPKPEVWALGMRNPWRMSFDRQTGELWCGDVGQDKWEEVDIIKKGGNYGWNLREGSHRYKGPRSPQFTEPVLDYGRDKGFCVIGGYVYRGRKFAALSGKYIFGDFGTKRVWALETPPAHPAKWVQLFKMPEMISSFGEDENGELYILGYDAERNGRLYTLGE